MDVDDDQLRAVVAHEVYHLRHDHPRLLGHLLSLTSLTFLRYDDEHAADIYAAKVAGAEAMAGALDRLGIEDRDHRTSLLRQSA